MRHNELKKFDLGFLDVRSLEVLWSDLKLNKEQRWWLIDLLCAFDLMMKLRWPSRSVHNTGGRQIVGIPALLRKGWDDFSWTRRAGQTEIRMSSIFLDFCPAGLQGVLIARLHRTVGNEDTQVDLVRANAAILTTWSGGKIFVCIEPENCRIGWVFLGEEKLVVRSAYDALQRVDALLKDPVRPRALRSRHLISPPCTCGGEIDATFTARVTIFPVVLARWLPQTISLEGKCHLCQEKRQVYSTIGVNANSSRPSLSVAESRNFVVFLSHAGEDKWSFVGLLKREIEHRDSRIRCYLDDDDLPGSDGTISDELKNAIDKSEIGVFVLSPEFVAKNWTMWELEQFLERRDKEEAKPAIYPIFYRLRVDDDDLCNREDYQPIFEKHGFFSKDRRKKRTPENALSLLRRLTEHPGSRRKSEQYFHDFAADVASKIIKLARSRMEASTPVVRQPIDDLVNQH